MSRMAATGAAISRAIPGALPKLRQLFRGAPPPAGRRPEPVWSALPTGAASSTGTRMAWRARRPVRRRSRDRNRDNRSAEARGFPRSRVLRQTGTTWSRRAAGPPSVPSLRCLPRRLAHRPARRPWAWARAAGSRPSHHDVGPGAPRVRAPSFVPAGTRRRGRALPAHRIRRAGRRSGSSSTRRLAPGLSTLCRRSSPLEGRLFGCTQVSRAGGIACTPGLSG